MKDQSCQPLNGFRSFPFVHERQSHCVYAAGSGAPVVLMHELPGMTPECVKFADHLVNSGFRVYLPLFFGKPCKGSRLNFIRVCIQREFLLFTADRSSPISTWLRALCGYLGTQPNHERIGVIGMCLTGSCVFACSAEPAVKALVSSQPATPLPLLPSMGSKIGVSHADLAVTKVKQIPVFGIRFSNDCLCQPERFNRLERELSPCWRDRVVEPPAVNPNAHSVLTGEWVRNPTPDIEAAVQEVIAFLRENLTGPWGSSC